MAEYLDGDRAEPADVPDVFPVQLPAQHDAPHPQLCGRRRAGQGVYGHLCAAVEGQVRHDLPGQGRGAPVLYNHRVHAPQGGQPEHLLRLRQLPVCKQCVQRQIHLCPPQVAVAHRLRQLLRREIPRTPPGVPIAAAQIDCVRAVLHGGGHRLPMSGRGQQLQHQSSFLFFSSCCCSLKISRLHSLSSLFALLASSRYPFS